MSCYSTSSSFYKAQKSTVAGLSTPALSQSPSRQSNMNSSFYLSDDRYHSLQRSIPQNFEFKNNTLGIMQKLSHFNRSMTPARKGKENLIRSDFQVMKKHITTQLHKMKGNHSNLTNKTNASNKNSRYVSSFIPVKAYSPYKTDFKFVKHTDLKHKIIQSDFNSTQIIDYLFQKPTKRKFYIEEDFNKEKMKLGFFKAINSNFQKSSQNSLSNKLKISTNNDHILKELLNEHNGFNFKQNKAVENTSKSFKKTKFCGNKLDATIEIQRFSHNIEKKSAGT